MEEQDYRIYMTKFEIREGTYTGLSTLYFETSDGRSGYMDDRHGFDTLYRNKYIVTTEGVFYITNEQHKYVAGLYN
jgi:hypothetical protein